MLTRICLLIILTASTGWANPADLGDIHHLMLDGQYEKANALLTPLVNGQDAAPRALYLKARAQLFMGNFKESQRWAESAIEAAPDSGNYWTMLGTAKAFQIRNNPMKGITMGRSSKKNLEKGLQLAPENLGSISAWLSFKLYAPGLVGGNRDEAARMAEQIFQLDLAEGHLARAQVFRHNDGDLSRARSEMQAAVQARPDDPAMCNKLAETLFREGFPEEALVYYRLGAELDPDPAQGSVRLGNAYFAQGLLNEARVAYQSALDQVVVVSSGPSV